jgi:putative two-component system response regulator
MQAPVVAGETLIRDLLDQLVHDERHSCVDVAEARCRLQVVDEQLRASGAGGSEAHEAAIHRLAPSLMHRDEETRAHVLRTGRCSELLAAAVGWDVAGVDRIRLAAPLHDIGKICVPDSILRKPGKLTPDEFLIVQTHTLWGARILSGFASPVLQMAREIALSHHERWDGRGYPAGWAESAIPESARIVAIVDVFDALTHDRVYRPAFPESEVIRLMKADRASHFDPRLLDIFMSLLPEMQAIAQVSPDVAEADHAP